MSFVFMCSGNYGKPDYLACFVLIEIFRQPFLILSKQVQRGKRIFIHKKYIDSTVISNLWTHKKEHTNLFF